MIIDLSGKIALVTGGSEGIGFAIAQALIEAGAKVYITGRRLDALQQAESRLGPQATAVQADSSSPADIDALFAQIGRDSGHLDLVVANAAVAGGEPLGQITPEGLGMIVDTNFKGTVMTVQGAVGVMAKGGSIVLLSSIHAFKGVPGGSVYAATKAAIRSLARSWAMELKDQSIRVNVLTPGAIVTEGLQRLVGTGAQGDAAMSFLAGQSPMNRMGEPAEIANAAVFLLSDKASFVNGADFQVDGGAAQI
jgi:NAD(P)-dependent dehydrogenase (short-subunit alcohol dehydrogenase family)